MIKNCYNIFITPPKTGKTKQFPIHKGTFYILIFLLFIFIIGDCIAILKYCESVKLKKENIHLKAEQEKLEKVAKVVDELKKAESFIRHFLGLEKSGSPAGGLGMGGVDPNFIDSSCTITLATDNKVSCEDSDYKVLPIEEALLLKRNLQELIDELIDRKGEWDTKPAIMPVKTDDYWISSGFGWRKSPFTGLREFHRGLDISARRGTPIIAPA
ncbi:MAG: M23 family metallopeptidase, partial [Deltaproteobacteria bacterium]|nr:M23 family metallopeptidase [Deltaproteobacteria bacterium]